jgi:hypothetical protein
LSFESPFTLPEPVFRSPRNLRRMLGLKVKRNWHQPAAVVSATPSSATPSSNLHGIVLIADTIPLMTDILAGQIPTSTPTMTFCWRNMTNTLPRYVLSAGKGRNHAPSLYRHHIKLDRLCHRDAICRCADHGQLSVPLLLLPGDTAIQSGGRYINSLPVGTLWCCSFSIGARGVCS